MIIETVKVKSDDTESGFVIMNKSDFTPSEHVLFENEAPSDAPAAGKKSNEQAAAQKDAELAAKDAAKTAAPSPAASPPK